MNKLSFFLLKILIIGFLILLISVFLSFQRNTVSYYLSNIIEKFNEIDKNINNGEGYSFYFNDQGFLAWGESYILESYIDMYLTTENEYYLEKFITHANRVVKNSDFNQQILDYKGKIRYGWSSSKYSIDNVNHVHMVHTGMITYPLLLFSYLVKEKKLNNYYEISREYKRICELAIREFDSQYVYDPSSDCGYYYFEIDEPIKTNLYNLMPCNSVSALGRSIFLLYLITENSEFLAKSISIAKFFKNYSFIEHDNKYIWGYRPVLFINRQIEDYSHGSIEISFVDLLYSNNFIFDKKDIDLFINTFLYMRKETNISYYVDGTFKGKSDKINYTLKCTWWLDLSKYSYDIYLFVFNNFLLNKDIFLENSASVMLTLAKLAKYYHFYPDKLNLNE